MAFDKEISKNEGQADAHDDIYHEQPSSGSYFAIKSHYIRDLSFELPRHDPDMLNRYGNDDKSVNVEAKISNSDIQNSHTEFIFSLRIVIDIKEADIVLCALEIHYGAIVALPTEVASQEDIGGLINLECPRLLLPTIRNILILIGSHSPFSEVLDIDPISLQYKLAQEYFARSGRNMNNNNQ